jgi:glycosyltransferase involved in cell wall biosynthesis
MPNELIVLSHLRWDWVWQRPQQIVSRIGKGLDLGVWFIEEPMTPAGEEVEENRLVTETTDGVTRVWLQIPEQGHHVGFFDSVMPDYVEQLPRLFGEPEGERVAWIYTPLALPAARALKPTTLVYDVMDDLAAFKSAAPELVMRHRQALREADVVFAGGRSLHRSVVAQGRTDAVLVPSGVSGHHYGSVPRASSRATGRPVAGYVGVLDERLDLELLEKLANELSDWTIRMIGPIAKIDPETLPEAPNIEYLGKQEYDALPGHMARFDVGLMPFVLNEATRSISPTKTLEYLAAGLPVVSTRIADVVAAFSGVVEIHDDAVGFAAACRQSLDRSAADHEAVARIVTENDWDTVASKMANKVFGRKVFGHLEARSSKAKSGA